MREKLLSWGYKQKRKQAIQNARAAAMRKGVSFDFETVIEDGEKQLKNLRSSLFNKFLFHFDIPKGIQVKLYDLTFPSPITFAAFQGDLSQLGMWLDMGIGGGCFKTILKEPREGNLRPRIAQVTYKGRAHLINAYGLPGKGVGGFLNTVAVSPLWRYNRPLGISLGGHTPEEYWDVFSEVETVLSQKHFASRYYYEINISCPNTDKGRALLENPSQLEVLLTRMRSKTDRVIGVKLSPDQTNESIVTFALAVKSVSKTFLTLGNTQYRTCEQVGLPSNAITIGGGGLSGPSLFKRTEEMIDLVSPLGIPFIATGGISTVDQVKLCLKKGATAVGIATGLALDPYVIPRINNQL